MKTTHLNKHSSVYLLLLRQELPQDKKAKNSQEIGAKLAKLLFQLKRKLMNVYRADRSRRNSRAHADGSQLPCR